MLKNVTSSLATNVELRLKQLGFSPGALKPQLTDHLTLSCEDGVLCLCHQDNLMRPLCIDFCTPQFRYRLQRAAHEQVVKACRIKNQKQVRLLDATCGLGRDALLLQQAGFSVTAYERHPVLAALLADALTRMPDDQCKFNLHTGDAKAAFKNCHHDVIYLDPMFPESTKSARVKKDMAVLQHLHRHDVDDGHELFNAAWQADCQRIVVKRPQKAETLSPAKPTYHINGKTCRFDVYQRV